MTHRFPLKDFETALDIFEKRKEGAIKVAIKPNGMLTENTDRFGGIVPFNVIK